MRSLVALHGGSVTVSSEGHGRGSTFEVQLPLVVAEAPAHHAPNPRKGFAGWRVLVVDDNQDATATLQTLLESLGATVCAAGNGREALEKFEGFAPDAVLLDIGMPGMDGYEVARRIRALPAGASTPLIAVTGWGQQEDIRRCFEAGFDHHLVKPLDVDKLWDIIVGASPTVN